EIAILVRMGERFQYRFSGNHVFEAYELRGLLTNDILTRSDAVNRIVELIEAKYRAAGFHFVRGKPEGTVHFPHHVNLVGFRIPEGEGVRIDQVTFSNAGDLGENEIESIFFDGAPGVLSRYLYWEAGFKEAIANFQKKLQSMGYLSNRVSEPKPTFSDDQKR